MHKIRLIREMSDNRYDTEDYYHILEGASDWVEVTDEEFAFLKSDRGQDILFKDRILVIEDVTSPVLAQEYINDVKTYIKKQKDRYAKELADSAARAKARKEKVDQRKLEKAKKLLQENGLL